VQVADTLVVAADERHRVAVGVGMVADVEAQRPTVGSASASKRSI
jgi:hypothetical protein